MFMPMRSGQFSLHHTHLVHNSRPNLTDDRRIRLGISYIPSDGGTAIRPTSLACFSREAELPFVRARPDFS